VKIRIGVVRTLPGGQRLQRAEDILEIEVTGGEWLSRIWMDADGLPVLSLPLELSRG
jgi:hypothetical protein